MSQSLLERLLKDGYKLVLKSKPNKLISAMVISPDRVRPKDFEVNNGLVSTYLQNNEHRLKLVESEYYPDHTSYHYLLKPDVDTQPK
jgi:hypothetical protein